MLPHSTTRRFSALLRRVSAEGRSKVAVAAPRLIRAREASCVASFRTHRYRARLPILFMLELSSSTAPPSFLPSSWQASA